MTDSIEASQERNYYKDLMLPMPLLEITRMRADIASSRAEWAARYLALRESQSGRGGQPTLSAVRPNAQANAKRLKTSLSARLFAVVPRQYTTTVDANMALGQAKPVRRWLIPWR